MPTTHSNSIPPSSQNNAPRARRNHSHARYHHARTPSTSARSANARLGRTKKEVTRRITSPIVGKHADSYNGRYCRGCSYHMVLNHSVNRSYKYAPAIWFTHSMHSPVHVSAHTCTIDTTKTVHPKAPVALDGRTRPSSGQNIRRMGASHPYIHNCSGPTRAYITTGSRADISNAMHVRNSLRARKDTPHTCDQEAKCQYLVRKQGTAKEHKRASCSHARAT